MSTNSLLQIRDYINTRMSVIDSDMIEWKDSLEDIGNIPQTILDRSYHISIGSITSSTNNDIFIEDSTPITVTIFKRAFNEQVESRDIVLEKANCIRLDMINPVNVESYKAANDGNIEDIQSVSITPIELNVTNDNIIKVEIELNLRLFFCIT